MRGRGSERRQHSHEPRPQPPPSPANAIVLMVVGALAVFAAATAVAGSGYDNVTPHGQVLGDLSRVAEAQERYYRETGRFAGWVESLRIEPKDEVQITILRGDTEAWEALVEHQVGLTCMQAGAVENGLVHREEPTCFLPEP